MQFLILLMVAGLVGYLLSVGDKDGEFEQRTAGWMTAARSWLDHLPDRLFPPPVEMQLKTWALGEGAVYFPRDFRDWLADLSGKQAHDFAKALGSYLQTLGYQPEALFRGDFMHSPDQEARHAQAILDYSRVYRKAKDTQRSEIEGMKAEV